jgi:murein L,D-transpeptidase YcbB/YkuD
MANTRRSGSRRLTLVLVALAVASGCGRVDRQQFAGDVERLVTSTPRWVDDDTLGKRLWVIERQFYEERNYLPAWIDGEKPTKQLDELLQVLRDSELHGLHPATYGIDELTAKRETAGERWIGARFEKTQIPELDVRLTHAYFEHAADLLGWRASPRDIDRNWLVTPKKADLAAHLRAAIDGNDVRKSLEALTPVHPQYKGLQAALARYRKEGNEEAAEKVAMNLERWRWAPRDLGERHILVNVPMYQMQVIEDEKPVLAMRVIVGAPDTPTPLFSDQMTYVVFSPYWNIPESILREETLPRLSEDPEYLARNNMEVVGTSGEVIDPSAVDWSDEEATKGLRFRQAPGPDNALGLVKFIFPNHFNVYLHDTPGDRLFNKQQRALSHGCIRIEQPVALAEYVLADRGKWSPERIEAAMQSRREQSVTLDDPLPVHIGYWTAWVEGDGNVKFVDDVYGLDRKHAAIRARQTIPPRQHAE